MTESRAGASVKLVVLYAILFLGVFGGFFTLKAATGTEYPIMIVVSESMEPTLAVGDYIFVRNVENVNDINVGFQGDIIVFHKPSSLQSEYIVHRAVDKFQRSGVAYFKTKGDNNLVPDWWDVPASSIIGVVYGRVPLLGYFSLFERLSGGIISIVALVVLIFLIDYIIPRKSTEAVVDPSITKPKSSSLVLLTSGFVIVSFTPYLALLFLKDSFVPFEVAALIAWYASNVLLPLAVRDEDNSLMLWLYQFALVIIPAQSDLIYRFTAITPSKWWSDSHSTVSIIGGLSNETIFSYRYLSALGLLLIPGCIVFFFSWGRKRRGRPLLNV